MGKCGPDSCGSRQGQFAGSCEHDNEILGEIKIAQYVDELRNF